MSAAFVAALTTAVILGIAGSGHCVAMCGGIAGAFAARRRGRAALASHAGRIASYTLAGLVVGALGAGAGWAFDAGGFTLLPSLLSGALLIAVGVRLARDGRGLALLDRLGARAWRLIAPFTRRFGPDASLWSAFAAGSAWGWLPCGMTYGALLLAAASGGALEGAATMLVFGLGTTPALVAAGALLQRVRQLQGLRVRRVAGWAVVAIGAAVVASPWWGAPDGHAAHDHPVHVAVR